MHDNLTEKGINHIIYNGAIAGHNSSQELLKVIRDIHVIKPDILISYNGINEIASHIKGHEMLNHHNTSLHEQIVRNQYQSLGLFYRQLIRSGNFRYPITGLNLGPKNEQLEFQDIFQKNIKRIEAISKIEKTKFYHILQPFIFANGYKPSQREKEIIKSKDFLQKVRIDYPLLKDRVANLKYSHDFTNILNGSSDFYTDGYHLNEEGNRIVAEHVFKLIKSDLQ